MKTTQIIPVFHGKKRVRNIQVTLFYFNLHLCQFFLPLKYRRDLHLTRDWIIYTPCCVSSSGIQFVPENQSQILNLDSTPIILKLWAPVILLVLRNWEITGPPTVLWLKTVKRTIRKEKPDVSSVKTPNATAVMLEEIIRSNDGIFRENGPRCS